MQALIDFDGWRRWKDFSHKADEAEANKKAAGGGGSKAAKKAKNRQSMPQSQSLAQSSGVQAA